MARVRSFEHCRGLGIVLRTHHGHSNGGLNRDRLAVDRDRLCQAVDDAFGYCRGSLHRLSGLAEPRTRPLPVWPRCRGALTHDRKRSATATSTVSPTDVQWVTWQPTNARIDDLPQALIAYQKQRKAAADRSHRKRRPHFDGLLVVDPICVEPEQLAEGPSEASEVTELGKCRCGHSLPACRDLALGVGIELPAIEADPTLVVEIGSAGREEGV
jgi:hypothetical protein